ncbi:MAG TPA: class I SAM-dependent methyltransferase [Actinomycetes bacterium]|nr:class I SAM-dependent methyltransferase [Actinomycetes bacterium]
MTDVEARYDRIADFYTATVGDRVTDEATAALLELVGDIAGRGVLDLACGPGRVSRELSRRGARVVGLDLSVALLDRARLAGNPGPGEIDYRQGRAEDAATLAEREFDAVVCNYGLSDIDDLTGAIRSVTRLLRRGGRFVFSILHPCFPGYADAPAAWPPGLGYYRERWWLATTDGFRGKVGANHRMLSTYLNLPIAHGLVLDRIAEPEPDAAWQQRQPGGTPVPVYFVARFVRP